MDEIIEGEVGISFKFEGKEYWCAVPELPEPTFKFDKFAFNPYLHYYRNYFPSSFNFLQGTTSV